jgi:hypothetical protein
MNLTLSKIDRSAYAAFQIKEQTGQPSQYYVDRQVNPTEIYYIKLLI